MSVRFGGAPGGLVPAVQLPLNQLGSNWFEIPTGGAILIPPGTWNLYSDGVACLQQFDPVMQVWLPTGPMPGSGGAGTELLQVDSDGANYRFFNGTSHPQGAILSNAGTGYTSAPTVTPSEGTSTWQAIVGGTVATSVTILSGGSNYTYAPLLIVQQPPGQGIPCTMRCTISGGVVNAVTVNDQGAGYPTAPGITFINDPRDTTGNGAAAACTLTGAQTVTALLMTDAGSTGIQSGTVPTLTFTGGGGSSAAATAVMDWLVTAYTVSYGGAGYVAPIQVSTIGTGIPTTAFAYASPSLRTFWRTRPARIIGAVASTNITATGATVEQTGRIGGLTSNLGTIILSGSGPTTVATLTLTVGGAASFVYMQNAGG